MARHQGGMDTSDMKTDSDRPLDKLHQLQPFLGLGGWWLGPVLSAFEVALVSGQLGVLPGIPVVLLKSWEEFLSRATRIFIEDDNDRGVPGALKECEETVIKPLSRQ